MNVELTDAKRYELEKDNIVSILLGFARTDTPVTPETISIILNIDINTTNRLLAALKTDQIIK